MEVESPFLYVPPTAGDVLKNAQKLNRVEAGPKTWDQLYNRTLSADERREIDANVSGLLSFLLAWDEHRAGKCGPVCEYDHGRPTT